MPENSTCLELSISIPGLSSTSSIPSQGENGGVSIRGLDINQIPPGGEDDCMEDEAESPSGGGRGGPSRKKLRPTKEQSRLLEESFRHNHTLNPKQKEALAMQLKLKPRQVEVWFQNRRARSKVKQTEIECEYLKRWFGSLTEQNRRLQKEVAELRAMKVVPPTALTSQNCKPIPAFTFTMCPRCERVTAIVQDKVGPTNTGTTATASPTLSAKGTFIWPGRHPSAAC